MGRVYSCALLEAGMPRSICELMKNESTTTKSKSSSEVQRSPLGEIDSRMTVRQNVHDGILHTPSTDRPITLVPLVLHGIA